MVPHLPDRFPALAAEGLAGGTKCEIGWAAAVMWIHARRNLGILRRLRCKAMLRGRISHVAQTGETSRLRSRANYVVPNQPIGTFDVLLTLPLAEHRPEAVRHALVQTTCFIRVVKLQAVLGDTVGQLMSNDIVSVCEVDENAVVAIAVKHLRSGPLG